MENYIKRGKLNQHPMILGRSNKENVDNSVNGKNMKGSANFLCTSFLYMLAFQVLIHKKKNCEVRAKRSTKARIQQKASAIMAMSLGGVKKQNS